MDAKELVERCRRGEGQAMGLLYSAYAARLERVCRKYVKDEADVHDIVHDSFVIIFTSIDKLKDAGKLESWMCTIVRNLSLKHLQRPVATSMESMEVTDGEEEEPAPDYSHLMTVVDGLPAGYQNVLKLSVLEGLSHKEIGKMLGIEPHSSSSQLARAKVMVRRSMKRYAVLWLALLAIVVPLLLPDDEEEEQKPVAEADNPHRGTGTIDTTDNVDIVDTIDDVELDDHVDNVEDAENIENIDNDDNIDNIEAIDHLDNLDNIDNVDADTTPARQTPRVVPDMRGDRLLAEESVKKRVDEAWTLAVSFAGGNSNRLLAQATTPGVSSGWLDPSGQDNPLPPDTCTDTRTHHHMPITLGVALSKPLSAQWSVEAGLRYTLLRSDITTVTYVTDGSMEPVRKMTTQKTHYIGIPLKLTYNFWQSRAFSVYGSGGAAIDIPVGSSAPVRWSLNFGAGLQYKLTPHVGIYAEPGFNRYLDSDRRFDFTIPVGLKLSW